MKSSIAVIVPDTDSEFVSWIHGLLELQLLANVTVIPVSWKNSKTGSPGDWNQILFLLEKKWDQFDGFVVWSPQQSILALSAHLSLTIDIPGKPIVCFQAPLPNAIAGRKLLELGIRSQLIKSVYTALSDLAEVLILNGENLYRPAQCKYGSDEYQIVTVNGEVAHISNQLHKLKTILPRTNKKPTVFSSDAFSQSVMMIQFQPSITLPIVPAKSTSIILQIQSSQKRNEELLSYVQQANNQGVSTLLLIEDDNPKIEEYNGVLTVHHPNNWWISILLQHQRVSGESLSNYLSSRVK